MRITKRLLSVTIIILLVLTLLFAFGYVNSLVSYKYEVMDSMYAGQALDQHQKYIMLGISLTKAGAIACAALSCLLMFVRLNKPTFKGRVSYC